MEIIETIESKGHEKYSEIILILKHKNVFCEREELFWWLV